MIGLRIDAPSERPLRLLCLGAHSDDIEIGCGGTVASLCQEYGEVDVRWVVFSGDGPRADEAREGAASFLEKASATEVQVESFRDGFFPQHGGEIKDLMEGLAAGPTPDVIFTHYREDRHQDHRVISDFTWNTWRDHVVLEYEVPKYDGDLGIPNCFVPLTREQAHQKIERIESAFRSQSGKPWFSGDVFGGLMRLRGIECRAPEGYAEAFYGRKIVLG